MGKSRFSLYLATVDVILHFFHIVACSAVMPSTLMHKWFGLVLKLSSGRSSPLFLQQVGRRVETGPDPWIG